jgi:hypothetical protein
MDARVELGAELEAEYHLGMMEEEAGAGEAEHQKRLELREDIQAAAAVVVAAGLVRHRP